MWWYITFLSRLRYCVQPLEMGSLRTRHWSICLYTGTYSMVPSDDDSAVPARNALSFLRTNSTLKSLTVIFMQSLKESYVSAFRLEAVKMLENTLLESLTICSGSNINVEEFFALLSALQLNTTPKTLGYQTSLENLCLTDDEVNEFVRILMKNYGLEHLVPDIACADDRTIKLF
jgi:hypothetical protein